MDKPNMISQQNSKLGSAQKTEVLTSTSGPQRHHCSGWSKWSHVAHCQSALCFFLAGAIAEPKVKSSSGGTFWQLFQGWLWVMWTWTFPVSFTTMDFVFCKSGVALFLHHQDTMSYWNLVSRILCPIRCSKKCASLLRECWWWFISWLWLFWVSSKRSGYIHANITLFSGDIDGGLSRSFGSSEMVVNI